MADNTHPDTSAVPSTRLGRAARMGGLGGTLLGSVVAGGAQSLLAGRKPRLSDLVLTPANARRITDELSKMRGAAMKLGQLLSMDTGDVLPPELSDIFARLRAQAHHMPPAQLKTVLIRNWGPDFLRSFRKFDVRPIAAASIGQVHRATTKDGRDLAIKVQYPGIRHSIDSDIRNLGSVMKVSGVLPKGIDIDALLEDARQQLHEEADYSQEARAMTAYADALSGDPRFVVPRPAPDLSTQDILAMDFIDSVPIEAMATAPQNIRDSIIEDLITLTCRELFVLGTMQTDPNFANFRYQPETDRIVLLDFGATRRFPEQRIAEYRQLLSAALSGDRAQLHAAALNANYLTPDTADHHATRVLDLMETATAPLSSDQPFDFATSPLARQMTEAAQNFAQDRSFAVVPPTDTLFLHRKVAGLYLLAARLGAKLPLRPILTSGLALSAPSATAAATPIQSPDAQSPQGSCKRDQTSYGSPQTT